MDSRDRTPTAQETFAQMAQAAGLRGRLLLTVGMLALIRVGIFIPIPGIDRARFAADLQGSPIIGFLDIFSGGGLSALGIFALGILPYINASIIIQLLTSALPTLENLQKNEGEAGRRKIAQITRYVSLAWAIIQSVGIGIWVQNYALEPNAGPIFLVQTVLALVAGSMFVMWVAELITERGLGNGPSLLIFISIISGFPKKLGDVLALVQQDNSGQSYVGSAIILFLVFIAMIVAIVFVQEGMRRIPIISARRQVGKRTYLERSSYLPLRLNQGGVMPIIFASSVLVLPLFIAQSTQNPTLATIAGYLSPNGPMPAVYIVVYLLMILFFSFFYATLVVNPVDLSQNLKKMGSSIPGIRPGRATSEYVERVLNRLTFLGAIFLGLVAVLPIVVESSIPLGRTFFQGFGATSLLILVGVAIDTSRQIQTYVISQRYEGMVKQ
jgi:preprotein translocase subunit SecY